MKEFDPYKFERDYLTDWDNTLLSDESEPRIIPNCKVLREMIGRIRSLEFEVDDAYHQMFYRD